LKNKVLEILPKLLLAIAFFISLIIGQTRVMHYL